MWKVNLVEFILKILISTSIMFFLDIDWSVNPAIAQKRPTPPVLFKYFGIGTDNNPNFDEFIYIPL